MRSHDSPELTALVASCNEGHLLDECLRSLQFCRVIVVDLESSDDTVDVAKKWNATVVPHERVPVVEILHREMIPKLESQFVLLLDPDERIDPALALEIEKTLVTMEDDVGLVYAPWQFYFNGRPLRGTVWGGTNRRRLICNQDGIVLHGDVHSGTTLKKGYRLMEIARRKTNVIHHFWMRDTREFFQKHRRYLHQEGEARFNRGERFSHSRFVTQPCRSFWHSYMRRSGYRDGITGLLLSGFWAWYETAALRSLKKHQRLAAL